MGKCVHWVWQHTQYQSPRLPFVRPSGLRDFSFLSAANLLVASPFLVCTLSSSNASVTTVSYLVPSIGVR